MITVPRVSNSVLFFTAASSIYFYFFAFLVSLSALNIFGLEVTDKGLNSG